MSPPLPELAAAAYARTGTETSENWMNPFHTERAAVAIRHLSKPSVEEVGKLRRDSRARRDPIRISPKTGRIRLSRPSGKRNRPLRQRDCRLTALTGQELRPAPNS